MSFQIQINSIIKTSCDPSLVRWEAKTLSTLRLSLHTLFMRTTHLIQYNCMAYIRQEMEKENCINQES